MTIEIRTSDCSFVKSNKALYVSAQMEVLGISGRGYPKQLFVTSDDTGRSVKFVAIKEGHPQFNHDFWDGEMAIYEPVIALPKVDILVISYGM